MVVCEILSKCSFFREYEKDPSKKLALGGFAFMYCKGDKQDQCIRKKVSKLLGGAEKVPVNMMPNGCPLAGTTLDNWSEEVKNVLIA